MLVLAPMESFFLLLMLMYCFQVYHDSEEGRQYMQFYNIKDWPYVAVIDPVTGENMVVWNKLDCNTFCELGKCQIETRNLLQIHNSVRLNVKELLSFFFLSDWIFVLASELRWHNKSTVQEDSYRCKCVLVVITCVCLLLFSRELVLFMFYRSINYVVIFQKANNFCPR